MPVWHVYRSFDVAPTGKHLRRFDDDTVLGWFQRNWNYLAVEDRDLADQRLVEVLGYGGWPLFMPFIHSAESGLPPPVRMGDVVDRMIAGLGNEEVISDSPHVLEMMTEDDGEGGAVYFFDGHFLEKSAHRVAWLLHDDWRLPSGAGAGGFTPAAETKEVPPAGDGPGATWAVFLVRESKYPIDDLAPAWRIDGVRLPGLLGHLEAAAEDYSGEEDKDVWLLPALGFAGDPMPDPIEEGFWSALRADPSDALSWSAWNDWRSERGAEPPGISLLRDAFARMARFPGWLQDELIRNSSPEKVREKESKHLDQLRKSPKSLIHVEEHLAQMCLDGAYTDKTGPYFGQWILFDDLWASAQPDLADGLLTWCARWDVLSGG